MADVFISYKSNRRAAARHLANIVEAHGFSVWFDYALVPGKNFGRHIEAELRQAKAVVVLWCPLSVESDWVLNEASLAKRLGKCIPARIAACEPPLEFLRDDYVDLADWDGDPSTRSLDRLIDRFEALVGREAIIERRRLIELHTAWTTFGRPTLAKFALGPELESLDSDHLAPAAIDEPDSSRKRPVAPVIEMGDGTTSREAEKLREEDVNVVVATKFGTADSAASSSPGQAPSSGSNHAPAQAAPPPPLLNFQSDATERSRLALSLLGLGLVAVALGGWFVWGRPDSPAPQSLAECRENTSDPAKTITTCTLLLFKNPNPTAYLIRAEAYHRLGQYDLAIADYTKSMEKGTTPQALKGRADAYRKKGADAEAARDHKEMFRILAPKQ